MIKIAWRNLGRSPRRTLVTALSLAVGTALCVATYGLMDGMNVDILRALTRLDLGHVQVHHPDYPAKKTLRLTLKHPGRVVAAAEALPDAAGVSRRVYAFALASHGSKSAGVQLVGIDPAAEPRVTEMHTLIVEGRYLDPAPTPWPEGRQLSSQEQALDERLTREAEAAVLAEIEELGDGAPPQGAAGPAGPGAAQGPDARTRALAASLDPPPQRPPRVFVGVDLARILRVGIGGKLFVATQTENGLSVEVFLQVAGILRTGTSLYDRGRVYLHLSDLQRLVRLKGQVHEVALAARDVARSTRLAAGLRSAHQGPEGALVRSWDEIRPDIKGILQLNEVSTGVMVFIIYIVAALGVVNTMLMAVFERTRELGMLKAIGMSGGRIVGLVVAETSLLVLAASLAGAAVGLALDLYMMTRGVDLSFLFGGFSVGGMGVSPVIHAAITVQGVLTPVVVLGLLCFAAAFYPAARAARMRPAQGMREV